MLPSTLNYLINVDDVIKVGVGKMKKVENQETLYNHRRRYLLIIFFVVTSKLIYERVGEDSLTRKAYIFNVEEGQILEK